MKECEKMDDPRISALLFHPREENGSFRIGQEYVEEIILVDQSVGIGCRLYLAGAGTPVIIFFHGNGEIVADYDDVARQYISMGISFIPIDYRGYGISTGSPSASSLIKDAHLVFEYLVKRMMALDMNGPVIIMGRSLGSAPALEIASRYTDQVSGLIIESGFSFTLPLMRLMGIDPNGYGLNEEDCFKNYLKVQHYAGPLLIIHAEQDIIIPVYEAKRLYELSPASLKTLVIIPHADHNTIFYSGFKQYFSAVSEFIAAIMGQWNDCSREKKS